MSAASGPRTRRRVSSDAASVRQFRSNLKMKKNSATFRKMRTSVTLVRTDGPGWEVKKGEERRKAERGGEIQKHTRVSTGTQVRRVQ